MAASFPAIPKDIPRWMYEAFRRLQIKAVETSTGLAAVGRGEVPDGSGTPLPGPDLSQFFYLPGRVGGQIGYGGINSGDDLFLGSTAHSGKGSISLGDILLINEGSGYVGINYLTPTVALDVQGTENSSGSSIVPTSDISAAWAPDATHYYTSLGGASTAGSHFTALALDDGSASFVAIVDSPVPNGSNPEKLGLGGVIVPGSTYTVTAKVFTLSGTIPAGTRNLLIYLVDSAGDQWQASTPNQSVVGVTTTASTFTFTITCSGSPVSSGNTANAVWLSASAGDYYVCVSYVAITTAREEIQRWRDADSTIRSGITAAGAYYLSAGAAVGYILMSDANGVGAWASAASLATRVQYDWRANGPYIVMTEMDGQLRIPSSFTITSVRLYRKTAGSSGSTIVDLNKNGTTMFTTQGNRPTVTAAGGNNQSSAGTLPDVTSVAAGDVLSIDIDQIEGGTPADFVLMIEGA